MRHALWGRRAIAATAVAVGTLADASNGSTARYDEGTVVLPQFEHIVSYMGRREYDATYNDGFVSASTEGAGVVVRVEALDALYYYPQPDPGPSV